MRSTLFIGLAGLIALGCRPKSWQEDEAPVDTAGLSGEQPVDADGDGYAAADDCDDTDASVHPDAAETCNGIDDDCDGSVDEDVQSTWWADADGDGYGDPTQVSEACGQPDGAVAPGEIDCDDADADTHPDAPERCDGIDNDCDGSVDEDVVSDWYADADGDGYGDPTVHTEACDPDEGWVADHTDCDDGDPTSHPDAEEVCDEADNDCDGDVDEDVQGTFWSDADGDGYGDPDSAVQACEAPSGTVANDADCDDTNGMINPRGVELCDAVDNDCDGTVDEDDALDAATWTTDADGDGYGDPDSAVQACEAPSGTVALSGSSDCDDGDAAINPAAAEVCDGVDNDCDGDVDDDDSDLTDASTWYIDYDGDGFGSTSYSVAACDQPSGYVSDDTDCDDTEADSYPGNTEVCDELDNDCDGTVDEDDATDATTWYADADADGYGDASVSDVECWQPSGYVSDDTDCDDTQATVYPAADELYDSLDNDCDGDVDEDLWIGTGADGALSVTGTTDLSDDASGTRRYADAVAYGVTAISGDTLTLDDDADGIAAGDELLLINLQGSDDYHAAVGGYEFASVSAVSGDTLTLAQDVDGTYGEVDNTDLSDQIIVAQRVPHYTDVTVQAGATLTTSAWDTSLGGVLAFRATGTVSVADGGTISVSELGFAGGETGSCYNCDGFQGESYAGVGLGDEYGGPYNEAIYGYLANYGGGGCNVTGGGGEYGGGATGADSWYPGVYTAPDPGDTYGDDELASLFLGSGGGGVWNGGTDDPTEDPGPGGGGAGILYIGAGIVQVDGADGLQATGGTTPYWSHGSWTYGAGGGSGGSVFLIADTVDIASGGVNAEGGLGETSHTRQGGDGGDGRVRIDCNTCNGYSQGTSDADSALEDASEPDPGYSTSP